MRDLNGKATLFCIMNGRLMSPGLLNSGKRTDN